MSQHLSDSLVKMNVHKNCEQDLEAAMKSRVPRYSLAILGTRGIPARHGGFETFAEKLAIYLVNRGWEITVYCQYLGRYGLKQDNWQGIKLMKVSLPWEGAKGSILFDLLSIWHASQRPGLILTLGYNTAVFSLLHRIRHKSHIMNMDGLEWQRDKWSLPAKIWLYFNERAGCLLTNHLVADHPVIATHLGTRVRTEKITMIPYGADEPADADLKIFGDLGVQQGQYALIVARPEPENSILEMVQAFSARPRNVKLLVLGRFDASSSRYHRAVIAAASDEVLFPGAIYDKKHLAALRKYNVLYLHGHQVGGTNPSLVEALATGSPVLAHDNPFNRWVAGGGAAYFNDVEECDRQLTLLLPDVSRLEIMAEASLTRFRSSFRWSAVLADYEALFLRFI